MKKLLRNKNFLICFIVALIIIIILILFFLLNNKEENSLSVNKVKVKYSVVADLYANLEPTLGDKDYTSKLYGYTYDEDGNIEMTVKEGYILNDKVYDLDDNYIGDYVEEELNAILDKATSKKYSYIKTSDGYALNSQ